MSNRPFVHSRMRSLRRATAPWLKSAKRKPDRRAPGDPLRKIHLRARGRKFVRDSGSSIRTHPVLAGCMAILAMIAGYRLAVLWEFDVAGCIFAPFVLVGLWIAVFSKAPLGARLIGFLVGLGFLLWPLYT